MAMVFKESRIAWKIWELVPFVVVFLFFFSVEIV